MPEPNQPMQPITNPVLVDAMATFKLDLHNREHEKAFLEAAVQAKYLLPVRVEQPAEPPAKGENQGTRLEFLIMTNPNGGKFLPGFTDEIELKKTRKPDGNLQIAVMSFMDVYRFMKASEGIDGMVINPFGSALCLVRQQIIAIGDNDGQIFLRPEPKPVQPAGQPVVQAPKQPTGAEQQQDLIRQAMADLEASRSASEDGDAPEQETAEAITDDLLAAMKAVLKKQKAVKKAYIKEDMENGERYLLVALEADESADLDAVQTSIASECADYADLPFECVASTNIRAKELVAAEKPFYEKKRFGIF